MSRPFAKKRLFLKPRPPGFQSVFPDPVWLEKTRNNNTPIVNGYFQGVDKTRLFYSTEGNGLPIIFCYGLVCSSLHWTYQIEYLRQMYQTVWFDYRGHQNSDLPKNMKTMTVSTLAQDMGLLLDELKIKEAVFLGHSMGVNVVLEFYKQQPKRVKGMILANGTPRAPLESLLGVNLFESVLPALKALYASAPRVAEKIWKSQKYNPLMRHLIALSGFNIHLAHPDDIALYVKQVLELDPQVLLNLIEDYNRLNQVDFLHTINVPALILAGENDKVVPLERQKLLHQLIPDSHFDMIRSGSHCPQLDLPELINIKIERFLADVVRYPPLFADVNTHSDHGKRQSTQ